MSAILNDQYAAFYKEQKRNDAWRAKFREVLEASANGESEDWLRFLGEDEAKLIAIATRDPNPVSSQQKTAEVLAIAWERAASAAADIHTEQIYGW